MYEVWSLGYKPFQEYDNSDVSKHVIKLVCREA